MKPIFHWEISSMKRKTAKHKAQNYLSVWKGVLSIHTVARPLHKHTSIPSICLSIYY